METSALVHILVAILGIFFLVGFCIFSLLFLVKRHQLKTKKITLSRFVSLEKIEKDLIGFFYSGLFFLTITIASGFVILDYQNGLAVLFSKKFIWTLAFWFWFVMVFWLKKKKSFSTQLMAKVTLIGFLVLSSWIFIGI